MILFLRKPASAGFFMLLYIYIVVHMIKLTDILFESNFPEELPGSELGNVLHQWVGMSNDKLSDYLYSHKDQLIDIEKKYPNFKSTDETKYRGTVVNISQLKKISKQIDYTTLAKTKIKVPGFLNKLHKGTFVKLPKEITYRASRKCQSWSDDFEAAVTFAGGSLVDMKNTLRGRVPAVVSAKPDDSFLFNGEFFANLTGDVDVRSEQESIRVGNNALKVDVYVPSTVFSTSYVTLYFIVRKEYKPKITSIIEGNLKSIKKLLAPITTIFEISPTVKNISDRVSIKADCLVYEVEIRMSHLMLEKFFASAAAYGVRGMSVYIDNLVAESEDELKVFYYDSGINYKAAIDAIINT